MDTENSPQSVTRAPSKWRRRAVLAGGVAAAAAWVKGVPYFLSPDGTGTEFKSIEGLEPFRRLVGATPPTSPGVALFAGLDGSEPPSSEEDALRDAVRNDPCAAFFGAPQAGPVPVAMFSDFRCPICKVMKKRLAELQEQAPDSFRIIRHELPLLSSASHTASKAVLAADRQGKYLEMHERLARAFAITDEAFVRTIADDLGLDSARLLREMKSDEVEAQLRKTRAIADVFGFYGTPAFAVGRTVFLGGLTKASLERLIIQEVAGPCQT